ncbi:hypothetical protein NB459_06205 [Clostridioides difficile]|nr:hypothetical protein [Clostridioides difficile]
MKGHGVQYPSARCISNVSDCLFSFQRPLDCVCQSMKIYYRIIDFHRMTSRGKERKALPVRIVKLQ